MNRRVASFAPSLAMECPSACSAYMCSTPYRVISSSAARANETPVQPWGRGRPFVPMMYFFSGEQSLLPCMMNTGVPSSERKSAWFQAPALSNAPASLSGMSCARW